MVCAGQIVQMRRQLNDLAGVDLSTIFTHRIMISNVSRRKQCVASFYPFAGTQVSDQEDERACGFCLVLKRLSCYFFFKPFCAIFKRSKCTKRRPFCVPNENFSIVFPFSGCCFTFVGVFCFCPLKSEIKALLMPLAHLWCRHKIAGMLCALAYRLDIPLSDSQTWYYVKSMCWNCNAKCHHWQELCAGQSHNALDHHNHFKRTCPLFKRKNIIIQAVNSS